MPRRPAMVTQADIARAIRVAKEAGVSAVIRAWADQTFGPASSNARAAARANEDIAELLRALTADENHAKAVEEVADVVIMLCRLQSRRRGGAHDGDQSHAAMESHGRRARLPRPRQDNAPR
jgi:hypothetical protein